jgi:hypothetical protein
MRLPIVLLLAIHGVAAAAPAEKEVARVELGGKPAVVLSVLRQRQPDGGLKLRVVITTSGDKKTKSVTLYEGGADDDGPTDKAFRAATVVPFTLPADKRGARIDFEFQIPGSKKFRQVDSYLVSVDEAPRIVLDVTTRRERKRSKVCHEAEEATLTLEKDKLLLRPVSTLESELDDDDLPIDKTCRGKQTGQQITYRFDGDKFFQIDPPPRPAKKPAGQEDAED